MIGAGILIAYFVLFGYNALAICYHDRLYFMIFGQHNYDYILIQKVVISVICLILSSFGLYFFISGLRKIRKSKEKTENQNLLLMFIILYSIILITTNIMFVFELTYQIVIASISDPPAGIISWNIFVIALFYGMVVFVLVTIVVIIQNYFLKKSKLIDLTIVKRPVVHFFLLGSLIIWVFFLLNNYIVILPMSEYFHLGYICSQIITSFIAAGVYLELVIKLKKSKQEINIKS